MSFICLESNRDNKKQNSEEDANDAAVANFIIDTLLENLQNSMANTTYHLHNDYEVNFIEAFHFLWDPCSKRCKLKFIDCVIFGLNNISRYGDVIMSNEKNELIVQLRLQVYNLTMIGKLSVNLIGYLTSEIPFHSTTDYQIQYMDIAVGEKNQLRLRHFIIEKLEGANFELELYQNSSILTKIKRVIHSKLMPMMENQMREISQNLFFPILAGEFQYFHK